MEYKTLQEWITLYDTSIALLEDSFLLYIANNHRDIDKETKLNYKQFKEIFGLYCIFINDELLERWY